MDSGVPYTGLGQRRGARRWAFAGLPTLAVLLVLAMALGHRAHAVPEGAQPAGQPRIDQSLILRPHTSRVALDLGGGISLQGTLAPTIPGPNAVHLVARRRSGAPIESGELRLTVTMPGMAMAPIAAVLRQRGGGFTGVIRLPMFGVYRLEGALRSRAGWYKGIATMAIALPGVVSTQGP